MIEEITFKAKKPKQDSPKRIKKRKRRNQAKIKEGAIPFSIECIEIDDRSVESDSIAESQLEYHSNFGQSSILGLEVDDLSFLSKKKSSTSNYEGKGTKLPPLTIKVVNKKSKDKTQKQPNSILKSSLKKDGKYSKNDKSMNTDESSGRGSSRQKGPRKRLESILLDDRRKLERRRSSCLSVTFSADTFASSDQLTTFTSDKDSSSLSATQSATTETTTASTITTDTTASTNATAISESPKTKKNKKRSKKKSTKAKPLSESTRKFLNELEALASGSHDTPQQETTTTRTTTTKAPPPPPPPPKPSTQSKRQMSLGEMLDNDRLHREAKLTVTSLRSSWETYSVSDDCSTVVSRTSTLKEELQVIKNLINVIGHQKQEQQNDGDGIDNEGRGRFTTGITTTTGKSQNNTVIKTTKEKWQTFLQEQETKQRDIALRRQQGGTSIVPPKRSNSLTPYRTTNVVEEIKSRRERFKQTMSSQQNVGLSFNSYRYGGGRNLRVAPPPPGALLGTPRIPEIPEAAENPEEPEEPKEPETQKTPEEPENPEATEEPEEPEATETPEEPETAETPEEPETPKTPENPEESENPETLDIPGTPEKPVETPEETPETTPEETTTGKQMVSSDDDDNDSSKNNNKEQTKSTKMPEISEPSFFYAEYTTPLKKGGEGGRAKGVTKGRGRPEKQIKSSSKNLVAGPQLVQGCA